MPDTRNTVCVVDGDAGMLESPSGYWNQWG